MSEPIELPTPVLPRNYAELHGGSPLARPLHGIGLLVRMALLTTAVSGCIIPPDLAVDNQDAGVNSPPAILAVRNDDSGELPEPGPVIFDSGNGTMTVDVIDTDVKDTLFVQLFFEYRLDHQTSPRAKCTAPPDGSPKRTATCDVGGVCLTEDVGATTHNIQIVVFDREPLDSGDPKFQAMPPGGLSTNRFYFLQCAAGPQ
ncbi:MAG: hypothetical protein ABI867_23445 [Kofleriaceae bacterium]